MIERGYYGSHDGELLTDQSLGIYMIDEAYQRILDKHEIELINKQASIISDLKKTFSNDIKNISKKFDVINDRIKIMESKLKKEENNATSKREESKDA